MLNRIEVVAAICIGPMVMPLIAAGQPQPTCSKGFQPYENRCISQRMADYITCVKEPEDHRNNRVNLDTFDSVLKFLKNLSERLADYSESPAGQ